MHEDVKDVDKELIDLIAQLSPPFSPEQRELLQPTLWHLYQHYHCLFSIDGANGKGIGTDADELALKKIKKTRDSLAGMASKTGELSGSRVNYIGAVNAPLGVRTFKTHVGAGAELKAATEALEAAVAKYDDYLAKNSRISPEHLQGEARAAVTRAYKKAVDRKLKPKLDADSINKIYTFITGESLSTSTISTCISMINKE